jgi:hypothetical protein
VIFIRAKQVERPLQRSLPTIGRAPLGVWDMARNEETSSAEFEQWLIQQ